MVSVLLSQSRCTEICYGVYLDDGLCLGLRGVRRGNEVVVGASKSPPRTEWSGGQGICDVANRLGWITGTAFTVDGTKLLAVEILEHGDLLISSKCN